MFVDFYATDHDVGFTCLYYHHTYLLQGHHLSQTEGRQNKHWWSDVSQLMNLFHALVWFVTWLGLAILGQLSQASPTPSLSLSLWSGLGTRGQLSRIFFKPEDRKYQDMCKTKQKNIDRMKDFSTVKHINRWQCLFKTKVK